MTSTNDTREPTGLDRTDGRIRLVSLKGDGVVIYDAENPSRWIQSDESVALGQRR